MGILEMYLLIRNDNTYT